MVCLNGIRCYDDEDADDEEEVVDDGPPRVCRVRRTGLDLGEDGGEEGDDPSQLYLESVNDVGQDSPTHVPTK